MMAAEKSPDAAAPRPEEEQVGGYVSEQSNFDSLSASSKDRDLLADETADAALSRKVHLVNNVGPIVAAFCV